VIILTIIKFHTISYAYTSLLESTVKKRRVIIDAENCKNDIALWDNVFPFGHEGI
jgi:hypothetical protein